MPVMSLVLVSSVNSVNDVLVSVVVGNQTDMFLSENNAVHSATTQHNKTVPY